MRQSLFERLLDFFKITKEQYDHITRDVEITDIPSFLNLPNILEAVELVKNHIKNNKKILIYGDYDADGVMATSILVKAFEYLDYKVNYYIPSRYLDGYGLNLANAEKLVKANYDLIITVDNGISQIEPIQYLRDNNIDVIVVDHHQEQEILPNANYIFHPIISKYGDVTTSGGFMSFLFASALLNRYDKYLSTLASISLVTDMMPLVSYNRDFLRAVIKNYTKGEFINIDYLLEDDAFNEESIGMKLGPKVNAVGRLIKDTTVNRVVKYFISNDEKDIITYYKWINAINETRKEKTKDLKGEVLDDILNYGESHSISLIKEVEEGLIGLIANSVMTTVKKPTVIFTREEKDPSKLKGSARSMTGANIVEVFTLCKDFALSYGGHALAGGITIYEKDFAKFKAIFEEYAKNHPTITTIDGLFIGIDEINEENYHLIESFSPFGEGFKAPTLILKRVKSDSLMYSKNKLHINSSIGFNAKIVAFYPDMEVIGNNQYIDLYGNLRINTFKGSRYLQFNVKDIRPSTK